MSSMIEYSKFEKITKRLNLNKYHICKTLKSIKYPNKTVKFVVSNWVIYRKDMNIDEYFDSSNKPILDSDNNTIEDLIYFINKDNVKLTIKDKIKNFFRR